MANLGYLPKLKSGLRLVFGANVLLNLFRKVFLIEYTINWQSFDV